MYVPTLRRTLAAAAMVAAAIALPAAPASAHENSGPTPATGAARLTHHQLDIIEDATEHLRTPAAAVAAGYLPSDACAELPGVGGMGYHYVNPMLTFDDKIDPARPEILVFVPTKDGGRRLGAVEYFKADADQDLSTTGDRPSLFGAHPFDGPMPGHEPGMPIHYDLHVWLYKSNPAGQLAAWNPRVHCPTVG